MLGLSGSPNLNTYAVCQFKLSTHVKPGSKFDKPCKVQESKLVSHRRVHKIIHAFLPMIVETLNKEQRGSGQLTIGKMDLSKITDGKGCKHTHKSQEPSLSRT